MSKELVVSASRHETRVAILEDDQLVEIFHQREQEYSLAGSIHKGRVTRVLPGMQSAFVDIGLERDAFLYVSDFFEDNEEYDKIVSGVEDKILKLERGVPSDTSPVSVPAPIEPEMAAVLGAVPGALLYASSGPADVSGPENPDREAPASSKPLTAPVLTGSSLPGGEQRRDNRSGRDPRGENRAEGGAPNREGRPDNREGGSGGRGRRGRRRRPGSGGLPESKFFSPRDGRERDNRERDGRDREARSESGTRENRPQAGESPSGQTGDAAPDVSSEIRAEPAGGLMVLPGESISKYVCQPIRDNPNVEIEDSAEFASGVVQEEHTQALLDHDATASEFLEGEQSEELEISEEPLATEAAEELLTPDAEAREASIEAADPTALFSVSSETRSSVEAGTDGAEEAAASFRHEHSVVQEDALPLETTEDLGPEPESAADLDTVDEAESDSVDPDDFTGSSDETESELIAAGPSASALGPETPARAEGEEPIGIAEASEDGSPEPARTPQSLTAALREQGNRLPHRVSRRSRRRQRGGERTSEPQGASADGQPSVLTVPQAVEEVKTQSDRRPGSRGPREERSREERPREQREEFRPAVPSITDLLHSGQEIIVQIAKEPLGQKGARITSHIALPGRFLVYMPTVDHIGVSRKIPSDEERQRLKRVLQTHRTGIPGGFIVRTAGENRTEEELRADMMFLYTLWMDMRTKAEKRPAPFLLHHDLDVVERILRDQLTSAFKTVWVDNELVYENVLSFVQRFQPAMVSRIKLYTRPTPIFDEFGITQELEKALRPKVWLKSGGYIVINQTEALVAIDINTGKYVGKSNRLEDTIVKINTDAIKEIVRQIRLRDLGGIIVVDFIDMDERKNRQKVMQVLEECMRVDRAPYKILQFNDFGLVAITRKRVKQSLERTLCSPCPYCESAGYVKSVQTVISEILQEAHKIVKAVEGDTVMLRVNPEVAKVLKSNTNDHLEEIESTLGKTVMIKSDPLLHQTKFDMA